MAFVLALDQGTTSSRAIVFDERGAMRGFDQREFPQHFPSPGWVEHDPADIWRSQLETARGAMPRLRQATLRPSASRISERPRCCGIVRRARRSPMRSCGRTGAPRRCAKNSRFAASRSVFVPPRDSCSIPISRERSWPGCSITWRARACARNVENSPSVPSTAGSCGI